MLEILSGLTLVNACMFMMGDGAGGRGGGELGDLLPGDIPVEGWGTAPTEKMSDMPSPMGMREPGEIPVENWGTAPTLDISTGKGVGAPEGGKGREEPPSPRAWESATGAPAAEAKGKVTEPKERKRRRRSLLTEEEGGLLATSPVYRRSLFG